MILTQPEPKREWLRQQHHMGEVQTDFHPCDAVLSTGTQVKPLPFCFSTFLPFSLFLNENYLQTQQNNLNNLRSSAVSPKFKNLPGCWSWFAFCFFGFVFFFCLAGFGNPKMVSFGAFHVFRANCWTECKLNRASGNLYQYYTVLSSRSCSWAENVQNKNREWLKHSTCIKVLNANYVLFAEVHIVTYQNTHISPFY